MSPVNGHHPALVPPGLGPVRPAAPPVGGTGSAPTGAPPSRAFADVLAERAGAVQFSGHALDRVRRRGIDLDGPALQRLEGGVSRAAAKGSREAVVFVDETAFVVSVRNRTVITAVDAAHMREHVFTNIDSAVIA
jgi:flagellar operon protein